MTVQKHVRFDDDILELIQIWRKNRDDFPSFNKAVNDMLRFGRESALFATYIYAKEVKKE